MLVLFGECIIERFTKQVERFGRLDLLGMQLQEALPLLEVLLPFLLSLFRLWLLSFGRLPPHLVTMPHDGFRISAWRVNGPLIALVLPGLNCTQNCQGEIEAFLSSRNRGHLEQILNRPSSGELDRREVDRAVEADHLIIGRFEIAFNLPMNSLPPDSIGVKQATTSLFEDA